MGDPEPKTSTEDRWIEKLKSEPKKLARYLEIIKRPAHERVTACSHCGHSYILPCVDPEDLAKCQNYAWVQKHGKKVREA